MKILYKQNKNTTSALDVLGVNDCYLKLITDSTVRTASRKPHHHAFYEVHIITEGLQIYEINEERLEISGGSLLFISPFIAHRLIHSSQEINKFAICFDSNKQTEKAYFKIEIPDKLFADLNLLQEESKKSTELSLVLTECKLCETIITLLRDASCKESTAKATQNENTLLSLAKQYITDNVERSPAVSEVASYCSISERQLTRLFCIHEGKNPKQFITDIKTQKIKELILDERLSLKRISEQMGFTSEYYFNSFFKKQFGMPPSTYRKMHGK